MNNSIFNKNGYFTVFFWLSLRYSFLTLFIGAIPSVTIEHLLTKSKPQNNSEVNFSKEIIKDFCIRNRSWLVSIWWTLSSRQKNNSRTVWLWYRKRHTVFMKQGRKWERANFLCWAEQENLVQWGVWGSRATTVMIHFPSRGKNFHNHCQHVGLLALLMGESLRWVINQQTPLYQQLIVIVNVINPNPAMNTNHLI